MGLVISTIEIDSIPASREEDLVANTIDACVGVREENVLTLGVCGVVGGSTAVV